MPGRRELLVSLSIDTAARPQLTLRTLPVHRVRLQRSRRPPQIRRDGSIGLQAGGVVNPNLSRADGKVQAWIVHACGGEVPLIEVDRHHYRQFRDLDAHFRR